jgi:hypothetical protein
MTRTGALHQSVRLAKVMNARHPSKLVANAVSEGQEAYVSYVKDPVGPGVLLGLQAGLVQTGCEHADSNAGSFDFRAECEAQDLRGSLQSNGGWIADDCLPNEKCDLICVLNTWRYRNELCFLSDCRDDPLLFPDASKELSKRKVNVAKVEITVDGFPYIAVFSAVDLASMQELIVHEEASTWREAARIVKNSRAHLNRTQQVNQLADKINVRKPPDSPVFYTTA